MKIFNIIIILLSISTQTDFDCPNTNFKTAEHVDLDLFISKTWQIQQQMENNYSPKSYFQCTKAEYKKQKSFWGWTLGVYNYSENATGKVRDVNLCAKSSSNDPSNSKLRVAPCFLPTNFGGP